MPVEHQYKFPIESERLYYRQLTTLDIKSWETFFIDNPYLHFVGVTTPANPTKESTIWIERQIQRYKDTGLGMLAAIEKSTNQLIGNVGVIYREATLGKDMFEIGYSVIPTKWKLGYASEMAIAMRTYFEEHSLDSEVFSIIHIDNIGSQKVAEKNGMQRGEQFEFKGAPCYSYFAKI